MILFKMTTNTNYKAEAVPLQVKCVECGELFNRSWYKIFGIPLCNKCYIRVRDSDEAVSGQPETVPGDAIGGIELTEADVEALVLPETSTETPKDNYPDGCCDSDVDADYLSKAGG